LCNILYTSYVNIKTSLFPHRILSRVGWYS
jgi:hypothetical protein